MKQTIVITGCNGLLGRELLNFLSKNNSFNVIGVSRMDFDITSKQHVYDLLSPLNPDYIIHAAAYTKVDQAEEEKELCLKVNETGTAYLAEFAKEYDCVFCYFSTDFIFDGKKDETYKELDEPNPINYYGYSKLKGEEQVIKHLEKYYIIRISWLYGKYGNNFVDTIVNLANEKSEISVVQDQIGIPTHSLDLAHNILQLITSGHYGIYHMVGNKECSWYEFAKKIIELKNVNVKILPQNSEDLDRKAKRPKHAVLDNNKINALLERQVMPNWESSIKQYLG